MGQNSYNCFYLPISDKTFKNPANNVINFYLRFEQHQLFLLTLTYIRVRTYVWGMNWIEIARKMQK